MKIHLPKIRRVALLISISLLVLFTHLLQVEVVLAHANLVRAEPGPSSVLAQPPGRVSLWFTEPIEPGFSEVQVLDAQGSRVDSRDSVVSRTDPTAISVTLPAIPNGSYTVVWKNLSTVDGHAVRGSFVFSIGEPIAEASQKLAMEQPLLQSPIGPVLRWLGLVGILAVVGGLGFELLVMRPVLSRKNVSKEVRGMGEQLAHRILRVIWVGIGLFLVASIWQLLVQTSVVNDIPFYKTLGSPLTSILKDTDWGRLWLWRIGLLLAMAAALSVARSTPLSHRENNKSLQIFVRIVVLVLGGWGLFTLSLVSHGAAAIKIRAAAVFSDYLHLLAAGFWVGGLFHFALGMPLIIKTLAAKERGAVLSAMASRFSALATLSVGTLVITGLYSAWAQVTALSALATPYGLALLGKISLVAPLFLLGALNLLWVRPRLTKDVKAGQWLRRFVTGEAILAALALLFVGLLTSLEPARQVASRQIATLERPVFFHDFTEGMHINLLVTPGQVGQNKVEISLVDLRYAPVSNADVSLRLSYLNADLGESPATAMPAGQGQYVLEKAFLSIAGPWIGELVVRRQDAFDARATFRFEVASVSTGSSAAITPSPGTGKLLWGVELVLLGFLFLGAGIAFGRWGKRTRASVNGKR